MRRLWRWIGWGLGALVIAGILVSLGLYRAAQQAPEFDEQALVAEPTQQAAAGDELERRLLDLRGDTRREGRWEAHFSEQQINGWLAADLPEKFPGLLPPEASNPRVHITSDSFQAAFRYASGRITAVISCEADIYLTDEPNVVAVRLRRVRAGALPLPLGQFLEQIAAEAANAGVALRWSEEAGDPLALITIPPQVDAKTQAESHLETLELREGEIVLAGRTERFSRPQAVPSAGSK
jgi:hypothetical protein